MDEDLNVIVCTEERGRLIEKSVVFAIRVPPNFMKKGVNIKSIETEAGTYDSRGQSLPIYSKQNRVRKRYAVPIVGQQSPAGFLIY
jgi:hypothetical protein